MKALLTLLLAGAFHLPQPVAYNADRIDHGDGTYTAEISGGWKNYLDEDDKWREIDTRLRRFDGGWKTEKAPFTFVAPEFADEEAFFESTTRFDPALGEIDSPSLGMWMRAIDAAHVRGKPYEMDGSPSAVIYKNAFPGADLIYYVHLAAEPQLEKLIRFHRPSGGDYRFLLTFSRPVQIDGETFRTADRAIGFKPAFIWDSKHREPINVTASPLLGGVLYTKHIPDEFFASAEFPVFADATATIFPDANPESSSFDGRIGRDSCGGTSWAAVRGASDATFGGCGIMSDSETGMDVYAYVSGGVVSLLRVLVLFDTSVLGADATVSSATLDLWVSSRANPDSESIGLVNATTASNTSISTGDFGTMPDTTSAPPTEGATRLTIGGLTTGAYNSFTLNASGLSWINKTGVSKFGVRLRQDLVNETPNSSADQVIFASADTSGTSNDPKLVITYTAPETFKPKIIQIMLNRLIPRVFAR